MRFNPNVRQAVIVIGFYLLAQTASADMILVGVFEGNDKNNPDGTALISDIIGQTSYEIDRVDWEEAITTFTNPQSSGDLFITGIEFKEDDPTEAIAGTWEYAGSSTLDYLTFKASNYFVLWEITDGMTAGAWDAGDWSYNPVHSVSHITAYTVDSVIPVPAAVWLFASGLIGLAPFAWRK